MDSLSHTRVAKLLLSHVEERCGVTFDEAGFLYGNLKPDLTGTYLTKRHYPSVMYDEVMEKLRVKYPVIVEGRYDKAALAGVVDTLILETGGFQIFKDPERMALLDRAKPVYETLPGWKCDLRGITDYDALPQAAKDYVNFIEERIGCPISIVSTGPKRHEIAYRR